MCGRFVVFSNLEQLKQYFPIDKAMSEFTPNYNVAPTQEILTIFRQEGLNVLEKLYMKERYVDLFFHVLLCPAGHGRYWGLVPYWAKDISTGYKMINAHSETLALNLLHHGQLWATMIPV